MCFLSGVVSVYRCDRDSGCASFRVCPYAGMRAPIHAAAQAQCSCLFSCQRDNIEANAIVNAEERDRFKLHLQQNVFFCMPSGVYLLAGACSVVLHCIALCCTVCFACTASRRCVPCRCGHFFVRAGFQVWSTVQPRLIPLSRSWAGLSAARSPPTSSSRSLPNTVRGRFRF